MYQSLGRNPALAHLYEKNGAHKRGNIGQLDTKGSPLVIAWSVVGLASMGISAYHGYKRNDSVGWAIWWAFMGAMFPIVTPVIAFAQGLGKPIKKTKK